MTGLSESEHIGSEVVSSTCGKISGLKNAKSVRGYEYLLLITQ
jgi:hypothetical protein